MGRIAAEALVDRLADWGVDTVFGLPGDGINGLMEGLRRARRRVRFILVRHEEAAAFMATGYAKATGRLGVCFATSGPGAIHLLNGLYDAKMDHVPVLAVTGTQETAVLGTGYQQEVHLEHLFQDVAAYNLVVGNPAQLPGVVDIAVRAALARRGVAHLSVPNDIQVADADADPWQHVVPARPPVSSPVYLAPPGVPREADLLAAAEVLNAGRRVAVLAGAGALGARDEVLAVADVLGAPVIKTLPGKAVIPDDSPFAVGGIGLLGTRPGEQLIDECDTLLMVGTNFPYTEHLPDPARVRTVQIEADAARAGVRMPTEVPVIGDAKAGLAALLPLLDRKRDRAHLAKYRKAMERWRRDMAALEEPRRHPVAPQYVVGALDELAADDAILTCDSGTIATWAARHWTIRGDRQFFLSGNLATMAPGLPYAIAMQHAFPGRQVIAYVGDGGFSMLMADFLTAVQAKLPVTVVINNNNSLGQILWEQMVLGYPEHGVRYREPVADFAAWARACGAFGAKVSRGKDVARALKEALRHKGPALVDVDVDPDEPPMPGQVRYKQAKKFAEAFAKGQPRRATIATTLAKDRIQQFGKAGRGRKRGARE
ncbi:thiamine pyrophosphate-dependent enzyme [Streptomyces marincola]|uniref:thiamine pyrophosphate-dependent enzyme n=1 Tax=Streptomyces marincola TaxID=2878388 RepID=UPI001CF58D0F|nr:thiamine pyrophosphate-dependent enzyme [Streptomyces marincola]UCM88894.1 thiamine pyrophosphate-dependent enzyme [Streptomyces marincola]